MSYRTGAGLLDSLWRRATAALPRVAGRAALVLGLLASPQAAAQHDPKDLALLPHFCQIKLAHPPNKSEDDRYHRLVGPTWLHLHHYCYGLTNTNRATLTPGMTSMQKTHELRRSIMEFDYVLNRVTTPFPLWPEVLTKKAENLIRLGRAGEALPNLQRAIELKPDYWPPYVVMSDFFKNAGDVQKAREWLEKGLAAAPETKALQSRLSDLGGGKGASRPSAPTTAKPAPPAAKPEAAKAEAPEAPGEKAEAEAPSR